MGNSNQHLHYDVPHILAGGASGQLKGGLHLAYPTKAVTTGNLLLSILNMFGVRQDSIGDSTGLPGRIGLMNRPSMRLGFVGFVLFWSVSAWAAAPSPVADAAMKHDQAAVRTLISQKADVNAPQADGATALQWAVYNNDPAMADLLIAAGANVKTANRDGATPLFLARKW